MKYGKGFEYGSRFAGNRGGKCCPCTRIYASFSLIFLILKLDGSENQSMKERPSLTVSNHLLSLLHFSRLFFSFLFFLSIKDKGKVK